MNAFRTFDCGPFALIAVRLRSVCADSCGGTAPPRGGTRAAMSWSARLRERTLHTRGPERLSSTSSEERARPPRRTLFSLVVVAPFTLACPVVTLLQNVECQSLSVPVPAVDRRLA